LTAFLHPRANAPEIGTKLAFVPSWNFSFHGKKKKKKRISSGFVGCFFFGFHVFLTGVFLVEQCLERETDTKTSPTLDFALRRGPRERKALMTYLDHTLRVCPRLY
jgi:hypothetical protein